MDELRKRLANEARLKLNQRSDVGRYAINRAFGGRPTNEDDRHAAASDAISDIFTQMFGPAGYSVEQDDGSWKIVPDKDARAKAEGLVERAIRSYWGDAEDYWVPLS